MINVLDGVIVLVVTVDTEASVAVAEPSELVGVKVEVDTTTVVEGVKVGLWVMVDDSVTTGGEETVGDVKILDVESSSLEEDVGTDDDDDDVSLAVLSVLSLPPVDSWTLWRLNKAIASSKGSADTAEAKNMPNRRTASLCMVVGEGRIERVSIYIRGRIDGSKLGRSEVCA